MMPILHKPVLEILIDHLARHGFSDVMVNTSYLSHAIENYFRDGSRFGVRMAYSFEGRSENGVLIDEPVGSAGAIRRIQEHSGFFDDTFLALCGDALIDLDLNRLLAFHREKKALATLALKEMSREQVSNYGVAVADPEGRIVEFQEKPRREEAKSTLINTGIYLFEPEAIEAIPQGANYDIGGQLLPALAKENKRLYGAIIPFQWLDIGNTSDYYSVLQMALQGKIAGFHPTGVQISDGVWVGLNVRCEWDRCRIVPPVWIAGSSTLEPGCAIVGPAMIGPGCVVESNAYIEKSLIFDYTRIGSQAHVKEMMICGQYCIDSSGAAVDLARSDVDWIVADARSPKKRLTETQEQFMALLQEIEQYKRVER